MNSALLVKLMAAEVRQLVDPMRQRITRLEAQLAASAAVPAPVSVVGASIDRSGHLLVVLSNGVTNDLGSVIEKSAEPSAPPALDVAAIVEVVQGALEALPAPKDGKDADPEVVRAMVRDAVAAAIEELPAPATPIGIGAAVINQAGHLLLTMTDGEQRDLGEVVGKGVDVDAMHQLVHRMVAQIPAPKDGRDGIATRDELLGLVAEAVATAVPAAVEAQVTKAVAEVPRVEYHGVWVEREFGLGDAVTFGGSLWICRTAGTLDKPGTSEAWQLAVKKGRDGRGS